MDQKIIFVAAAGIGAVAIVVFFVLGQSALRSIIPHQSNAGSNATVVKDLSLSIQNITVSKQSNNTAKVQIAFDVKNPNPTTALLENVHYTLSVGNYQMTSGDSGEVLEGFLGSQATAITIVPMGSVIIKNEQVSTRNNLTASSWDSMVGGTAKYDIEGWYAVRTTSNLETNYNEKNFNMTYPAG